MNELMDTRVRICHNYCCCCDMLIEVAQMNIAMDITPFECLIVFFYYFLFSFLLKLIARFVQRT